MRVMSDELATPAFITPSSFPATKRIFTLCFCCNQLLFMLWLWKAALKEKVKLHSQEQFYSDLHRCISCWNMLNAELSRGNESPKMRVSRMQCPAFKIQAWRPTDLDEALMKRLCSLLHECFHLLLFPSSCGPAATGSAGIPAQRDCSPSRRHF